MDYRRARVEGGTYFFAVVTHDRLPLFGLAENVERLRHALHHVKERYPFTVPACVALPDHLYCLWRLPEGDRDFSVRWRLVKQHVSHHVATRPFWQKRFWEHLIRDDEDYRRHLDYIHFNPVRHGWADRAANWPHSSFPEYAARGVYPADWGVAHEMEGEFGE